jgi:hypothetical protein
MRFVGMNVRRCVGAGGMVTGMLLGLPFGLALAQDKAGGPTPSPAGAAVYFVDPRDGATIPTKSIIHFGLRNMGVAPAGSDRPNSGHHHLLIDTPVPPLNEPIPNDFNHLHFGAGQTEAEVTLAPGNHTLQLLLADKDHIPHTPPVMSNPLRVKVVEGAKTEDSASAPRKSAYNRKPSPTGAKVYLVYPKNGGVVAPETVVRFGLVGMGVAPAGVEKANTGHHHLLIDTPLPAMDEPIPNDFNHLHFGLGQTEAKVKLPLGRHTLELLLGDENHVPHDPPIMSPPVKVLVTANGKLPRPRYKKPRRY